MIAITGGTGFLGRHLARELVERGDEVVLVARGTERARTAAALAELPGARLVQADVTDVDALRGAFRGASAVAHLAGISRATRAQGFEQVHVHGTRAVLDALESCGVPRLVLVSFLRARPGTGSAYHETKWRAEELVRARAADFTVLKAGVVFGAGDHLVRHVARALSLVPVFGLVGRGAQPLRPVAAEDVARLAAAACAGDARLGRATLAVVGPESLTLAEAVRRIGAAVGRRPRFVRLPVAVHLALAGALELVLREPLVSRSQVRMLAEGLAEPAPPCGAPPDDLAPRVAFTVEPIRAALAASQRASAPRAAR